MFDLSSMIYTVPALLIAITIHEYAHAATADAMGDPTPRYMGRLTFNPLAHLDILGAIMLALFHFGWAKPVAINPNNFRKRREGMIKVSLAGPAANLFLCFLAELIFVVMSKLDILTPGVGAFLVWTMQYNVWFAFFNLLPVPPLDGSRILCELLPPDKAYKFESFVGAYGLYILIALVASGIIGYIITPFAMAYLTVVETILGIFF